MLVEANRNARGSREAGASNDLGVALVTGGRRGIGRATCVELASRGFDVAFVDIADDDAAATTLGMIEEVGRAAMFQPLDIAAIDAHAALLDAVEERLGPVSCLVNNAGAQVSVRGDLLEVTPADFDRLININLRGTFFLTQRVARRMVATASTRERSIITITSANAHLVSPEKGSYGISKAGLAMAVQSFALRLAEAGIRVHEIRPGLIETDMTADVRGHYSPGIESGALCPLRRWGSPADIAEAVAALATGALPFSTGDVFNIGGGMQIPRL